MITETEEGVSGGNELKLNKEQKVMGDGSG